MIASVREKTSRVVDHDSSTTATKKWDKIDDPVVLLG